MNNYFTPKASKIFEEIGIKSDGKRWWSSNKVNNWQLTRYVESDNAIPTYTLSDILTKDALVRLFGDDSLSDVQWHIFSWEHHRNKIAEIYSLEGLEAVEVYIIKNMEAHS